MFGSQNTTLWISYSGISDFDKCPRLYFLKNLYTTPVTGRKIQVADPYLTLGSVIHRVIEEIAVLSPEKRKEIPLRTRFDRIWKSFEGKKGGFRGSSHEEEFYQRGLKMLEKLQNSEILFKECYPPPQSFPKVQLFRDKNIVLVGNFDWLEILSDGTLHLIDFKTGKNEEDEGSLQLPIYLILAVYNLDRQVKKTSYWYLETEDQPTEVQLKEYKFYIPVLQKKALEIEKKIKENDLRCISPNGPCKLCQPYEQILAHQAEYVGLDRKMKREIYYVND